MTKREKEDAEARAFLEAVAATLTQRAASYPPYSEEASKVARIWNVLRDADITSQDVALFMMIVKFVRLGGGTSADSVLDLCGYATRLNGLARGE